MVPCRLRTGKNIFLIDTPGFDDTYRSDTEILREIADWLGTSYQNKIKLTGIIYMHRITDVRIGGSGMKNLRMFRKLCGERGLRSVILATTMWSLCPIEDARRRENQLVNQNDLWKYLLSHGARVFRQDDGAVSGQQILDYLINRAQQVVLEIQHELVDKGMKLSETSAGKEVQEELQKMKEKHDKEMKEIREEMEQAIKDKDEERQAELREYTEQMNRQLAQAAEQTRQLEAGREQLRREMKEQHDREMQELRNEIQRRQQEIQLKEQETQKRHDELREELEKYKEKTRRQENTNTWTYHWRMYCSSCDVFWLWESKPYGEKRCTHCRVSLVDANSS
jgi:hypothetical protein